MSLDKLTQDNDLIKERWSVVHKLGNGMLRTIEFAGIDVQG